MKKLFLFLALVSPLSGFAEINFFDSIPNPNFRKCCEDFDTDKDGILSQAEVLAVKKMVLVVGKATSLEGIRHFANIEYLDCSGYYNRRLTKLDVSGLTNLEELRCWGNKLTALDVSELKNLRILDCSHSKLTALDVSGCAALEELSCMCNKFSPETLTALIGSLPDRSKESKKGELFYDTRLFWTGESHSPSIPHLTEANKQTITERGWAETGIVITY